MTALPDDLKMRRVRKVVDHGTGPFAIPLAQLTESIITNDKLDALAESIKAIELPEAQEIEIPEYPTEITVTNLPDVQKVEITNLPKDDTEVKKLLQQLVTEVKKKEQYTYDIEVDSDLKEQLRGEMGVPGKDGVEITPEEVRNKLAELEGEERLDVSAIKGLDSYVKDNSTSKGWGLSKATADTLYTPLGAGLEVTFETVSANLPSADATLNYNGSGDIASIVYSTGITKTFNYTGTDITSIVLSGSTPSGISLTKTLTYSSGDVTGIAYT